MQVSKAFFKVALKRLPSIIPYFIIFVVVALVMTGNSKENADFSSQKLDLVVIDNDDTEASRELKKYLLKGNNEKTLRSDDDEYIQDMLYHEMIDSVITIDKGFSDKLTTGETEGCIEALTVPSTFTSQYSNSIIDRFVTSAEMYVSTGSDPAEACRKAAEMSDTTTNVELSTQKSPLGNGLAYYCQYYAYIIICIIINGLAPILMRFFSLNIRRRIDVSALPLYKKNAVIIGVTSAFVFAVWMAMMCIAQATYGGFFTERGMYCLLNSFVLTLVVTGTLPSMSRQEAEDFIRNNGGTASGSVSRKTAYVVAGENAGSKLTKAQALGIPVIDEAELRRMAQNG